MPLYTSEFARTFLELTNFDFVLGIWYPVRPLEFLRCNVVLGRGFCLSESG